MLRTDHTCMMCDGPNGARVDFVKVDGEERHTYLCAGCVRVAVSAWAQSAPEQWAQPVGQRRRDTLPP